MTTEIQRPGLSVDVSLTAEAASQVTGFMAAESVSVETGGLRVCVLPGGCSGFKYDLRIEDAPLEDDILTESAGIRLFVDAFSAQYLQGTVIDYVSNLNGQGFAFKNPSATGGCGCGSSFSA